MNDEKQDALLQKFSDTIAAMTPEEFLADLLEGSTPEPEEVISLQSEDADVALIAKALVDCKLLQNCNEITFADLNSLTRDAKQKLIDSTVDIPSMFLVDSTAYAADYRIGLNHTLSDGLDSYFMLRNLRLKTVDPSD